MQHIVVVCGAGASSTFLAHWMRKVAADRALDVTISASSVEDLAGRSLRHAVVLVGSHLAASFDLIAGTATGPGTAAVQLPPLTFDIRGAAIALDLAEKARPHERHPQNETETTHG